MARKPRFDPIADFALPLPVAVICDLLGVPVSDRERFARGSRALIRAGSTRLAVLFALPGVGYTWESDVQIWLKRAIADFALMGTTSRHRKGTAKDMSLMRGFSVGS